MRLDGAEVPDRPDEIRACMVVRNEALRLPSVLDHHRAVGVDRFLVVDNASSDGTLDYLTAQRDVHILHAEGGYAANRGGLNWINAVLDRYCDDTWTLTVDADEQFVFPGYERVGLRDFCGHLDDAQARGVLALLLDMYGPGDMVDAVHRPGGRLLDTCGWFDPEPYHLVRGGRFPHVQFRGGVRPRVFDFTPYQPRPPVISKVPLVKWRRGARYLMSTHAITPIPLYPMLTALLHFKFLSDFRERVATAVAAKQHYSEAREYRAYQDRLRQSADLCLCNGASARFTGGDQLVGLGLMQTDAAYEAFLAERAPKDVRYAR